MIRKLQSNPFVAHFCNLYGNDKAASVFAEPGQKGALNTRTRVIARQFRHRRSRYSQSSPLRRQNATKAVGFPAFSQLADSSEVPTDGHTALGIRDLKTRPYQHMHSPSVITLYRGNIDAYWRSLLSHVQRQYPFIDSKDAERVLQLIVQSEYRHERFHYVWDFLELGPLPINGRSLRLPSIPLKSLRQFSRLLH